MRNSFNSKNVKRFSWFHTTKVFFDEKKSTGVAIAAKASKFDVAAEKGKSAAFSNAVGSFSAILVSRVLVC